MRAVIMAGGEGTRLRPLTSTRPKPMVPIVNQPVMEHILGLVKHHGIDEVVAALAYMPRVIEDYFGTGDEWGMSISYAIEETPLGTAGSVKNAEALLGGEPFIVISGDALTDIDLTRVVEFHRLRGAAVTIALKRVTDPLEFGVVVTDPEGRIERFVEKPSWGQVISDTINTGIYVVQPEVLARIPPDIPFDFSSDLFPLLMKSGYPLYGCVVDGYWCDVGSFESYIQVHRDVLDGLARIYIPGVKSGRRVWIGDGSRVTADVHIADKVVIGQNVSIRSGAFLGEYTILGDNCVVGEQAAIARSVIWSDTFIGKNVRVDGAVVCRGVDVRSGSILESNTVIGDEAAIGEGVRVATGAYVYPRKRVESGAEVTSNVVWGTTVTRGLFGENGISGLIGADITPELALYSAQAFGSLLPKGSHVVVSRDSSRAARMLKRAMVAGLNAAGCHARDLRAAAPALTRFTTRDTRCVAGIHVSALSDDPRFASIEFFDEHGLDIDGWTEKKLERVYFRKEFRRAFLDDVGEIMYPPRSLEYYVTGMAKALDEYDTQERRRLTVVVDFRQGVTSFVVPYVGRSWNADIIALNPFIDAERTLVTVEDATAVGAQLPSTMRVYDADLGVRLDPSGETLTLVSGKGRILDGDTALHAVIDAWCSTSNQKGDVAVPLHASTVVDSIVHGYGRRVVRPGISRRSLAVAVHQGSAAFAGSTDGGYMFGRFLASYDAAMSTGMIVSMLGILGVPLEDVIARLPVAYKRETRVACPTHRKGAVMRVISSFNTCESDQMAEGCRIADGKSWALIVPHPREPFVKVWVEDYSDAAVDATLDHWISVIEEAITNG